MTYIGKTVLIKTKQDSNIYKVIGETKSKKTLTLKENELIENSVIPIKIKNVSFLLKRSNKIEFVEKVGGKIIKIRLDKRFFWFILNVYDPVDIQFL
jgi:hypothetical protein